MSRMTAIVAMAVVCVALPGGAAAQSSATAQKVRVGVFDSRLVALAYYNSEEHRALLQQVKTDAVAASALQELEHYQVFSNASIPNVLEKLAGVLPQIAKEANVTLIVSKWEIAYRRDDVEYVDVTDALVNTFRPSAKVQKWIADGKTKDPLPLLQVVLNPHK